MEDVMRKSVPFDTVPYPVVRDFYVEHEPVYAPGFGPDDPKQVSMTRQEFAEESDINFLMARYERSGVWPLPPNDHVPQYLDVSNVPDLMTAMKVLHAAEEAFMTLPAKVRREFDNDPVQFVAFAENPDNLDQMREWNLAPPKEGPAISGKPGLDAPQGLPAAPVGPPSGAAPEAP